MKQQLIYNHLVRCYNRSRRKLHNLAAAGKNLRKQGILQRRIIRLFKTLTGLQRTLKLGMATAALSAGMLLFQPNAAHAQIAFAAAQGNPFGLSSFGFYSSPTFVDLDADGDMDMMTSQVDGKLYYSRNVGTASAPAFSGAQINPFGLTGGAHPSFADLDGDGDMDLMVGGLVYFENTGTASAPAFAAGQFNPFGLTGEYLRDPAFADLDADGDVDLMVGGYEDLCYYQNIGTASAPAFAPVQINPFGLSSVYYSTPTFADVDGDGDMDLMSGSLGQYNNKKYYFQNTGTPAAPAFAAVQINPFGLGGSLYSTPVFVDLDNDGDMDFMEGGYSGAFIYNQNTAFCSGLAVYPDADGDQYGNPVNSNVANDCIVPTGYVTISGDCNDNNPLIKPGASEIVDGVDDNCNGINDDFTFVQVNPFGLSNLPDYQNGIDFIDLDGDNDMDLMAGGFLFFENTGTASTPAFIPPLDNPFGLTGGQLPSFADLDGDGDMDLMAQSYDAGGTNLEYFENTGTASISAFAPPLTNPFGIIKLSWQNNLEEVVANFADLDADGDLDMIEGITREFSFSNDNYGYYGSFLYYENVGTPAAPVFAAPLINPFGLFGIEFSRPTFADVDNDGDMDLLTGNSYSSYKMVYFQNTGNASSPAFTKTSISGLPFPAIFRDFSFADLDADGDMDVMSENYSLSYYTNNHISCSGGTTVYADADGDQYGDVSNSLFVADCIVPPGYVDDSTDCNDANASIYPKECDVDDGIDDNCNGIADDGFGATTYFTDADGDGYGVGTGTSLCSNPGTGYATNNTDCNDADAAVYPGATEVENGIDDNCNGIIDDGSSCFVPANLTVTNITGTSAKLQWDDLVTALGYAIKYNTDGGNDKAKVTYSKSNSKPISGLEPNTTYFWRVKSVCSEDPKVTTDWSEKQYFTTAPLKVANQQATTMELYPNPVTDQFTLNLQLPTLSNQAADIFLLNTLGQVLYSTHAIAGNGTLNQVIAMPATAASGWYVVRVVMSDQVIEKKLLYQK